MMNGTPCRLAVRVGTWSVAALWTALGLAAISVRASGGPGIYAIVDKVVFEPNDRTPDRVQLWGAFIVPLPMSSWQYLPAQRGFLYFKVAAGREEVTRNEWADLKKIAGTGQAVGFADYWVPNPSDPSGNPHHSLEVQVHKPGDTSLPAAYPLGIGITKLTEQSYPDIVMQLRRALDGQAVLSRR
jgi:hypothetical protein